MILNDEYLYKIHVCIAYATRIEDPDMTAHYIKHKY